MTGFCFTVCIRNRLEAYYNENVFHFHSWLIWWVIISHTKFGSAISSMNTFILKPFIEMNEMTIIPRAMSKACSSPNIPTSFSTLITGNFIKHIFSWWCAWFYLDVFINAFILMYLNKWKPQKNTVHNIQKVGILKS